MKYEKGGVNAIPQSHPGSGDLPVRDLILPSPQSFPFSPETENTGVEGRFNGCPESEKLVFGKDWRSAHLSAVSEHEAEGSWTQAHPGSGTTHCLRKGNVWV